LKRDKQAKDKDTGVRATRGTRFVWLIRGREGDREAVVTGASQ